MKLDDTARQHHNHKALCTMVTDRQMSRQLADLIFFDSEKYTTKTKK